MGTVIFNPNFLESANNLLELTENAKEKSDIEKLTQIISSFNFGHGYNPNYVISLNQKLRRDYPVIDMIENHANNLPQIPSVVPSANSGYGDPYIEMLNWDHKGILATVFLKQNPEFKLAEFIVKVVK